MRILLLNDRIPPEGRGGAESVVWTLAKGLAAARHETHVVTTTADDSFEQVRDGIPTYHIHAGYPERFRAWLSLWNPQTAGAFRSLLERIQPDVVNAHNIHFRLSYRTLKLSRAAGCGVVFSAHDAMPFAYGKLRHFLRQDLGEEAQPPADYRLPRAYNLRQNRFRYNPFRNVIIKRCLERHAHIRTVPSQALADAFADNDMPPVEVVYNGIDLRDWHPVDEAIVADLRQRLDLVDKSVILIAGRLTAEKGILQILSALDHLRKEVPQARLLVLTSRAIESRIPAELARLRSLIRLGGWLSGDELRAAYQLADVVAVPSIYVDPFPTVALEAMAAGRPVVATNFGGAREAVIDGETGYTMSPFDTVAYAGRLSRILRNRDMRREMGRRGRERIGRHFSLALQVERMVAIYERALAAR